MPPPSNWKERLYDCSQRGFPAFARMRLIYDRLRAAKGIKKNEFYHLIGIAPKEHSTWKNILDGKVVDNLREQGPTRFDSAMISSAVAALKGNGYAICLTDLEDRMTEVTFIDRLDKIIPVKKTGPTRSSGRDTETAKEPDEARQELGSIPRILPRLTPWNQTGTAQMQQIRHWIDGVEPHHRHLGIAGPSGCGKTALVLTCLRDAGLEDKTLWFDCNQFGTYEILIDRFIGAILTGRDEADQGFRKMELKPKGDWILEQLGKAPRILVLDSIDSLFERPGELAESMRETLMEAFLHRVAQGTECRIIYLGQNSRYLGPNVDVRWMPITTTLYDPKDILQAARDSSEHNHFPRVGHSTTVPENDQFPAEQVFDNMLQALDANQTELLVFIALAGEEVRKSTILEYADKYLGVDRDQQSFLDRFWQQCHIAGAKVVQIIQHVYDDKLDNPTSPENLLHYKFHDSIILTAQRHFAEYPGRYRVKEIHRRIARRARDLMHEDKEHYRGSNVVGRFTRPAQVIKHLLASMEEQTADQGAPEPQIVAPINADQMEEGEEHWRDVWLGASAARTHLYCFGEVYRRYIDRTHRQSHLHGADRAKVDVLIPFLFPGQSDYSNNMEHARLPQLPVNLLCELLEGLAIAGLNCGALAKARWAVERARDVLAEWKRADLGRWGERREMVEAVTRIHADILVRGGHLAAAKQVCQDALRNAESDFLQVARPAAQDKLRVRHGNIIFMMQGVDPAIEYMETIGLTAESGGLSGFRSIDLTGLPGRLWVSLLLHAMRRGRRPEEQLAILDQARVVHKYNFDVWEDQGNEQLALQVEKSMLDRISRRAIEERNPDIVDMAMLPHCLRLLKGGQLLAWKRGVSPATRMELDIELAKVLYLGGDTQSARDLLAENRRAAVASGYHCYEHDILMLDAEILWSMNRKSEAEDLFKRLIEIEMKTSYRASHSLILLIIAGCQPTRTLPG